MNVKPLSGRDRRRIEEGERPEKREFRPRRGPWERHRAKKKEANGACGGDDIRGTAADVTVQPHGVLTGRVLVYFCIAITIQSRVDCDVILILSL